MIKGIIFDLDGVLIDSDDALIEHFQDVLKKFGFKTPHDKEIIKYAGNVHKNWIKFLLPQKKQQNEKLLNEMDDYGYKIYWNYHLPKFVKLYSEAKNTLDELYGKFKLAVVTGNPKKSVEIIFEKFDLKKYFDAVIALEDVEKPKPNAEPLLKAVARLNLNSKEVVYVGDSDIDCECGKNAGVKTIIVGDRKLKNKPQYSAKNLNEVLEIIKNISTKEKEIK